MWWSDEGVAPYRCLCQPKHPSTPKFIKTALSHWEWRGFQIPVVLVEYAVQGRSKNHDQGSKPNQDATDQGFDGELLV